MTIQTNKPASDNILAALNAAYHKVGYVKKQGDATGAEGNFKFAKEADFIAAIRPVLMEHGVIFFQSASKVVSHEGFDVVQGAKTVRVNRVLAEFQFTFQHCVGRDYITVSALGEGTDTEGDKAAYKAMTGALKYALRQTLLIETGDEPEANGNKVDQTPKVITSTQAHAIKSALGTEAAILKFLEHNKLEAIEDLLASQFDKAMAQVRRSRQNKAETKKKA